MKITAFYEKTPEERILKDFERNCINSYPGDSGIGGGVPQEPVYEWACEAQDGMKYLEKTCFTHLPQRSH